MAKATKSKAKKASKGSAQQSQLNTTKALAVKPSSAPSPSVAKDKPKNQTSATSISVPFTNSHDFLSELKNRRSELEAVIAKHKEEIAHSEHRLGEIKYLLGKAGIGESLGIESSSVKKHDFSNMSIPKALLEIFSSDNRSHRIDEIIALLKAGGIKATSQHFKKSVTSRISQLIKSGNLKQAGTGEWTLAKR